MKILVLSDTHGRLDRARDIYKKMKRPDALVHCGDFAADGKRLAGEWGLLLTVVRGNCDGPTAAESAGSEALLETPQGSILVVHGHTCNVHHGTGGLVRAARARGCIAVCYGHTHIAGISVRDGIYLINPGSLSLPRDGRGASYAVITATDKDIYANIVYYDTLFPSAKNKVSGGYLRGLINYSDGF